MVGGEGGVPGGLFRGGMSRQTPKQREGRSHWDNGVTIPDREYQGLT